MAIYSFLLTLALVLSAPWWLWRMATSGRYREGLAERLGFVPADVLAAVSGKQTIWVHAVSVGEVLAVERLIAELGAALPDFVIAISTTTATGQKIARERFAGSPVFYFPLDFAFAVRAWLRVLQPSLLVLVESEFWPRHLAECERARVPVAVVNARVSDRSFPRYMRLKRLWKPFLAKVRLFLAQGEESADRLRQIGAPVERVRVSGNLKYDVPVAVASPLLDLLREHLPQPNKPIVCGSTHDGEEAQILDQWTRLLGGGWTDTVLVLAPRHPERFPAVAALIAERGLPLIRASEFLENPAAIPPRSVFLLDTLGSLAATYALAKVAFIGGSLVPKGGHNPLEAARFGVPIVMGPHYDNFREIVDGMMAAQAIFIMPAMLTSTLHFALVAGGPTGERGRAYFQQQGGATGKSVEALLTLMGVPQRLEPKAVVDCNGMAEAGPLSKAEDAR